MTLPVAGLRLIADFVDEAEERDLLGRIDASPWDDTLRRRIQQYGIRYSYRLGKTPQPASVAPLPDWILPFVERARARGLFDRMPEQVLVNEYRPGQGISAHIDAPIFGPVVTSLTLGAPAPIEFLEDAGPISVWLPRRSLLVFSGRARSGVRHRIAARKSDEVGGVRIPRARRVSITFRTRAAVKEA
jgi:alkylated DNA repair dioxygenase AlkB